jgi:hypothetical protein
LGNTNIFDPPGPDVIRPFDARVFETVLDTVDVCEERTIFAETGVPEKFEDCAGVKIKVPG